jgi:hypothetical protein
MATGLDLITALHESQNRDYYPDGSPVRSPAGALFKMQVMPSTAQNPGFGIQPAASQTPSEYNRVGGQYLSAMQTRYNGDLSKAWAAYNWGPGNVDKAVKKYGPYWLAHAPAETQNYVNAAVKDSQVATSPIDLVRRAQAFNVDIPSGDPTQAPAAAPGGFDIKSLLAMLPQAMPMEQKKNVPLWAKILGVLGDTYGEVHSGRQGAFIPTLLQANQGVDDRNFAREKLNEQIASDRASLIAKLIPDARQPTSSIQDFEYAKGHGYSGSFDQFMQLLHPPTPVSVPYGAQVSGPSAAPPPMRYNPKTNAWEPISG